MRTASLALFLVLAACAGGPGGSGPGKGSGDPADDHQGDDRVPQREPDQVFEADLAEGEAISLGWAEKSTVACFPATQNTNFNGHHVIFELTQPAQRDLYIRVAPESGVDVSLYALQFGGEAQIPPDVSSARVCEASYDFGDSSNPGHAQAVKLTGHNEYAVVIGVAGAHHGSSGSFFVQVWDEPGGLFDDE